jgi:hypothetical protein
MISGASGACGTSLDISKSIVVHRAYMEKCATIRHLCHSKERTMTAQELLTELQSLGAVLAANGGRLSIDAPKGVITPAIRAELARCKAELLALLGQVPTWTPSLWEGQRVRLEDLPDFKARLGLRVVGGDPDLQGQSWAPALYLVEM